MMTGTERIDRYLSAAVILALAWNAIACYQADSAQRGSPMNSEAEKILQSSQDRNVLYRTAAGLAAGDGADGHRILASYLAQQEFLNRLDTEEEYEQAPGGLRVRKLVEILAKNPSPSAAATLLSLTRALAFTSDIERTEILIENLARLRPVSPAAVEFWDEHCRPDDVFHNVTIAAIVSNGSPAALALLEKKLLDPAFSEEDKLWWMRSQILAHRNDLNLLRSSRRMLEQGFLPERLKTSLLEVLFDYRPDDWFGARDHRAPPERSLAAPAAKTELDAIGKYALSRMQLEDRLQQSIRGVLAELQANPGQ